MRGRTGPDFSDSDEFGREAELMAARIIIGNSDVVEVSRDTVDPLNDVPMCNCLVKGTEEDDSKYHADWWIGFNGRRYVAADFTTSTDSKVLALKRMQADAIEREYGVRVIVVPLRARDLDEADRGSEEAIERVLNDFKSSVMGQL